MERLTVNNETPRGLNAAMLRTWGYLFILLGAAGRGFIQNGMLGLANATTQEILAVLETSENGMLWVTLSLILQAMEACAVPIFALLLVEGFCHTSNLKMYALRIALVAVASEVPYNLAFSGNVLELNTRNPVFALLLGLLVLWFYRHYGEKNTQNTVIKVVATLASVLWCQMLGIEHGAFILLMVAVLWATRGKKMRTLVGCIAAACSTVFSLFNVASPMSFLAIHFYNGEKGEPNRIFNLICYPVILLVMGLAAMYI